MSAEEGKAADAPASSSCCGSSDHKVLLHCSRTFARWLRSATKILRATRQPRGSAGRSAAAHPSTYIGEVGGHPMSLDIVRRDDPPAACCRTGYRFRMRAYRRHDNGRMRLLKRPRHDTLP